MNVLSAPRDQRRSTGAILLAWVVLVVGSWAALAGVAIAVYVILGKVWS